MPCLVAILSLLCQFDIINNINFISILFSKPYINWDGVMVVGALSLKLVERVLVQVSCHYFEAQGC